jgi:hypothetical protein
MDVARLETSQWPIVRRYCDMRLEEIVYSNVVPFRTEGGARGAYPFFAAGFERHLRPLMGPVKPALIVGLGVEIERRTPDWLREIGIVTIDRNRSLTTEQRNAQSARVRKAILGLQPG